MHNPQPQTIQNKSRSAAINLPPLIFATRGSEIYSLRLMNKKN